MEIKWESKYCLDIKMIDDQHQHLVNLYNKIVQSHSKKQPPLLVGAFVRGFLDQAKLHFKTEEAELRKINYQNINKHKESNDTFVIKITGYLAEFNKGNESTAEQTLEYIKDWLLNHILHDNRMFATSIKNSANTPSFQTATA